MSTNQMKADISGAGSGCSLSTSDHPSATVYRLRNGHRGVRRPGKWRTPVGSRNHDGPRHIGNIENNDTAVPIAHEQPVTEADGMMASVSPAVPGRSLATGDPLPGKPPAADLAGMGGI